MAQIRIKRSTGSSAPSSSQLANAELAFTEGNDVLWYGEGTSGSNAATVIKVGGSGAFCDLSNAQNIGGNKTFDNNVIVTGDLTVNGSTTTLSSTNSTIEDALIELGTGTTGSASNDAGLVIERGSDDNVFIGWDESVNKFAMGTGSFTGASTGDLSYSTGTLLVNLEGNVTGNVTGNLTGNVTGNVTGDVTGNADTATTLATARNIGGVSFNGSANINLPGVNTAGNQNTSGNAATATALATARTIAGTSFNGSADISISYNNLTNQPTIPTNNNQLTNGAGFITSSDNAATSTTATNANHVALVDNESTNENNAIPFGENATYTGNVGLESDGDFHYNPSTGTVTASYFAGTVDGGTW